MNKDKREEIVVNGTPLIIGIILGTIIATIAPLIVPALLAFVTSCAI